MVGPRSISEIILSADRSQERLLSSFQICDVGHKRLIQNMAEYHELGTNLTQMFTTLDDNQYTLTSFFK